MELYSVINRFPVELRGAISELIKFIREDIGVSREDFSGLKEIVRELSKRIVELAKVQRRTEDELNKFRRDFHMQITALGGRWGLNAKASFRGGMREILEGIGYKVERFEVRDGEVILVEIKSSASKNDMYLFLRKSKFYEWYTGRGVSKMVFITPVSDRRGYEVAGELGIAICTFIDDIGDIIWGIFSLILLQGLF